MSVKNSSFGKQLNGEPAPAVYERGHVFHKFCWTSSVHPEIKSPKFKMSIADKDANQFYPMLDSEFDILTQKLNTIILEKERFKSERDNLAKELEETNKAADKLEAAETNRRRSDGARIVFEEYLDAKCYNCESKEHLTSSCSSRPILKNTEMQAGGSFDGRPYEFRCMMQGPTAGELVKKYQDKFGMTFSRVQVQVVFAFWFFDSCCWNCSSPFHDLNDCPADTVAGIRKVAKLMHLEMHPLSDQEINKRKEKCLRYGK